jgi:hypothetical protein
LNQPEYSKRLSNALDYAGGTGAAQKKIDAIKGFAGHSPQKYLDYLWTKNTYGGNFKNGIKLMEGMGSTDQQRKDLSDMINLAVDRIDVDPKGAKKLFNMVTQTMQELSNGVFNAAEPVYKGTYRKMGKLNDFKGDYIKDSDSSKPKISNYSEDDIKHTAEKYGKTVDQVKRDLGIL